MAKRNRGEGTIYYSEARKQWIGQFTKTIAGEKIRKSVYGATKNEVSEKLLDLRIEMKDTDFIKEKGMPLIQIMELIRDKKYNSNVFNLFKDNELEKVIELYKNNSLGSVQMKNSENSPRENFKSVDEKNNSLSMIQEGYTEKFQNGTEEIYIDEEDDEMEF